MIRAEVSGDGVMCSVKGTVEDSVVEISAAISIIIDHAIEFDAEDGKRLAQTSVFEIMERVKAYSMRKYGFNVLDISVIDKLLVLMRMQEEGKGENK